ncbi:hypothetical protein L1267_10935 [Pseudoalteromonas sp. OFAV1]|jgi:hypothetical protein|uniref:hypothetical protein n=1 Tax=Pseudoalteromonas sp. OFAV1 TaxID=2908892 RepID=UPI001F19F93A|nr:hypothetical protein [Pseudoalteromonas sp. OFAV1]MCF2900918.1 hypothetical protein [Pseudoalteromonas sp. OFAV1]
MYIQNKLKVLALLMSLPMVSNVYASEANYAHGNAHIASNAKVMYDYWKNNKDTGATDPFQRISQGYSQNSAQDKDNVEATTLSEIYADYIETASKFTTDDIKSRKLERDASVESAYEFAYDYDDEVLNNEKYNQKILSFRDRRLTQSLIHNEERQQRIASITSVKNRSIDNINSSISQNSYNATINFIALMKSDLKDNKQAIYNKFGDNIVKANSVSSTTSDTLSMAMDFSNECPACQFIADPVVIEPIAPPPDEVDDPIYNPPIEQCGGPEWRDGMLIYFNCK